MQKGTKAPQAAGKIHTDFEKGFIMAEVMKFEDFKNEGSEAAVKVRETIFALGSTLPKFSTCYITFHLVVRPPENTDSKGVIT